MNAMSGYTFAIDATRVRGRHEDDRDPDAPDALWVPVVSPDREECCGNEAKSAAIRYVTELGQSPASGIDQIDGPRLDDGGKETRMVEQGQPINQFATTAEEYLRAASAQKLAGTRGAHATYVTFFRVRRGDLV